VGSNRDKIRPGVLRHDLGVAMDALTEADEESVEGPPGGFPRDEYDL
jgi:hypothetical protein